MLRFSKQRLEICSYNHHLPVSKSEKGDSILTWCPLKPTVIQDWLLQSKRMPGNCATRYASLVTEKSQRTHSFFGCLNAASRHPLQWGFWERGSERLCTTEEHSLQPELVTLHVTYNTYICWCNSDFSRGFHQFSSLLLWISLSYDLFFIS